MRGREVDLHEEAQDTTSNAWRSVCQYIDDLAASGIDAEFKPRDVMSDEDFFSLVTLPRSIGKLQAVTSFHIYGSAITHLPPEIGMLTNLRSFTPYTSYRPHWFPYEITRCRSLRVSTVSTRALYGNFKHRNPFPDLRKQRAYLETIRPDTCSVCDQPLPDDFLTRWVSLWVATDVLPLLVFACDGHCLAKIPEPADNYISKLHQGGRSIEQPPDEMEARFGVKPHEQTDFQNE